MSRRLGPSAVGQAAGETVWPFAGAEAPPRAFFGAGATLDTDVCSGAKISSSRRGSPNLLRGAAMTDRTAELEAAVRAQDALIAEAQRLLTDSLRPDGLSRDALIDELRKLLDGPRQREAERLSREALGEDFGNNA